MIMIVARQIEIRDKEIWLARGNRYGLGSRSRECGGNGKKLVSEKKIKKNGGKETIKGRFRRLAMNEIQDKWSKGICFRCDKRFSPGHKCKVNKLKTITLIEEEYKEDSIDEEIEVIKIKKVETNKIELASELVVGITTPKTMNLLGEIKGDKVVMLVDSETTHNFIVKELLEKWKFKKETIEKYLVVIGNGEKVEWEGKCVGVVVQVQGMKINGDFLHMKLESMDVNGVQWLRTLRDVIINWN